MQIQNIELYVGDSPRTMYNGRMDAVLKSNVFFFITSIAVVVCGILLAMALWQLMKILRNVRRATDVLGETFSFFKKKKAKK
jgi:hypothetical protein